MRGETITGRMARETDPPVKILGRFVGRPEEFGFALPPVSLRIKFLRSPSNWAVFIQPATEIHPAKLVEWLPTTGLLRIEFGSRRVLRADFQSLPETWATAFEGVMLDFARIEPTGEATATVTGTRQSIASFARRLYGPRAPLELVQLHASKQPIALLTLPQDDALRAAVQAGYYRIPRALNLNELAKKLGITSASLSERLRRAEGRIITRYVDAGSASPWDAQTLFADDPLASPTVEWPQPLPSDPPPVRGRRNE